MATYTLSISDISNQIQSDTGINSRLAPSVSQNNTQVETVSEGSSQPLADSSADIETLCRGNTYTRTIIDLSTGINHSLAIYNTWSDPRNNQFPDSNTSILDGAFVFHSNVFSSIGQQSRQVESFLILLNGVDVLNTNCNTA